MTIRFIVFAFLLIVAPFASAQYSFNAVLDPVFEDFTGFGGAGFAPVPAAGQLNSNKWRATGLTDGDGTFGGTHTVGDFARGSDPDSVSTGGVYAFDVGGGNITLGIQPGGSDFTPGSFETKIVNSSGSTITDIDLSYKVYVYNDKGRANSFNFSYSVDGGTIYTPVPGLDFTSVEAADNSPAWVSASRSTTLSSLTLASGSSIILNWTGDDVSGSGSRDQFGLDDVSARASHASANVIPEPSTYAKLVGVFALVFVIVRRALSKSR